MGEIEFDGKGRRSGTVAVVLARILIPLWLFTGAVLKLVDLSPTHLPAAVISWCGSLGLDLMFVLRFSIAVELIVVIVMVVLAPFARLIGLLMLLIFMPILAGDILMGASSCGCFGALKVNPWITLVTDVTFFVLLAVLGRGEPRLRWRPSVASSRVGVAGALCVASFALAFGLPAPLNSLNHGSHDDGNPGPADGGVALPAEGYFMPEYESWIGQRFADLEIASWIQNLPTDLDVAQQYVIFYRKDCEHCHELMEIYFSGNLLSPTTAVAVPERDGWPTENLQELPCDECRRAELPAGVDWFLKTPVLVRLSDGFVECASEVDPVAPECLLE